MIRNFIYRIAICCSCLLAGCLCCSSKNDIQQIKPTVEILQIDSMPDIKILSEIRVRNNLVYLTYESRGEYGQRHVKQYTCNEETGTLNYDKEFFKKDNGYYQLFAPSLFEDNNGVMYVYDRDIPSISIVDADGMANSTGKHLITTSAKAPYTLVQEARQAFYKSSDEYLFIGREPYGGTQALFISHNNTDSISINEVCKIVYDEDRPSWIINFGKAAYNHENQIVAYAYQLYPVVQFIDLKNNDLYTLVLPNISTDSIVTEGTDIWEQNPVQFKDITSNKRFFYALYLGKTLSDIHNERQSGKEESKIIKFDYCGQVIAIYTIDRCLESIGVSNDDSYIIGYDSAKNNSGLTVKNQATPISECRLYMIHTKGCDETPNDRI